MREAPNKPTGASLGLRGEPSGLLTPMDSERGLLPPCQYFSRGDSSRDEDRGDSKPDGHPFKEREHRISTFATTVFGFDSEA